MASPFPSSSFSSPSPSSSSSRPPYQPDRSYSRAPPLHVVVRFLALPDIHLEISDPDRFTVIRLKSQIRRELVRAAEKDAAASTSSSKAKQKEPLLPPSSSSSPTLQDAHRRRLRILYAGKSLANDVVLGNVLRPIPPPPRGGRASSISTPGGSQPANYAQLDHLAVDAGAVDGEGNPRSRSSSTSVAGGGGMARVIVSCSISDILPDSDLAAEEAAAAAAAEAAEAVEAVEAAEVAAAAAAHGHSGGLSSLASAASTAPGGLGGSGAAGSSSRAGVRRGGDLFTRRGGGAGIAAAGSSRSGTLGSQGADAGASSTTNAAPRGFERLLQAGFTTAEVNQLRLQFTSIQSARFTPDTMPSPDSLRNMEENWLDNNQGGTGTFGTSAGGGTFAAFGGTDDGGGGPSNDDVGLPSVLDTMVRGMLIGFIFPLGTACWLLREDGLWTPRWRMFVSFGVLVSVVIGVVKSLAGEW